MKRTISHIGFLLLTMQLLVVLLPTNSIAQDKESYIKAILIYKFIPFIKWPDNGFIYEDSKKNICTIGKSDVGKLLDVIAKKEGNQNYIISKEIKLEYISKCDVLYIADISKFIDIKNTEENILKQIVVASKINNILTVSDLDCFVKKGGMIGFVNKNEKIKFEINVLAVNEAMLSIEAILLELAVKIYR